MFCARYWSAVQHLYTGFPSILEYPLYQNNLYILNMAFCPNSIISQITSFNPETPLNCTCSLVLRGSGLEGFSPYVLTYHRSFKTPLPLLYMYRVLISHVQVYKNVRYICTMRCPAELCEQWVKWCQLHCLWNSSSITFLLYGCHSRESPRGVGVRIPGQKSLRNVHWLFNCKTPHSHYCPLETSNKRSMRVYEWPLSWTMMKFVWLALNGGYKRVQESKGSWVAE